MSVVQQKTEKEHVILFDLRRNVPAEMKSRASWVCWRYVDYGGRTTKHPLDAKNILLKREGITPNTCMAESDNPRTWSTFDQAMQVYEGGGVDGVGYCFGDDYCGIDIDKITLANAAEYITAIDSYTELSPSGNGYHIICRANVADLVKKYLQRSGGHEVYDQTRFFTVTGNRVATIGHNGQSWLISPNIENRQKEVEAYVARVMPLRPARASTTGTRSAPLAEDADILSRLMARDRFANQYNGNYADEPQKPDGGADWSRVIPAMVWAAASYSHDPDQIERIVHSSQAYADSGYEGGKWERFGAEWISQAIDETEEAYQAFVRQVEREKLSEMQSAVNKIAFEVVEPVAAPAPKKTEREEFVEAAVNLLNNPPAIKRKKRGYSIMALESKPAPKWFIEDHFPDGGFVVIFGTSGEYKSFIALDWAMCAATGTKYLGKHAVKKSKVTYIVSEGAAQFSKRARAWLISHNLSDATDICFVPHAFNPGSDDDVKEILAISHECLGDKPDLIVVDTLSRNFDGDPNSPKDMQAFCSGIDKFREMGITVVIVHHTGHLNKDRERSASNLRDSADTSILCEKTSPLHCRLTCKKQKDAEEFATYRLAATVVNVAGYRQDDYSDATSITFDFEGLETDMKSEEREADKESKWEQIECHLSDDPAHAKITGELITLTGMSKSAVLRLLNEAAEKMLVARIGTKSTGFKWHLTAAV